MYCLVHVALVDGQTLGLHLYTHSYIQEFCLPVWSNDETFVAPLPSL